MAKPIRIDRQKLHEILWRRADAKGKLLIHQSELAEQLGVSNPTLCRILKKMTDEDRLKKIAARKGNVGVYVIRNPASVSDQETPSSE